MKREFMRPLCRVFQSLCSSGHFCYPACYNSRYTLATLSLLQLRSPCHYTLAALSLLQLRSPLHHTLAAFSFPPHSCLHHPTATLLLAPPCRNLILQPTPSAPALPAFLLSSP